MSFSGSQHSGYLYPSQYPPSHTSNPQYAPHPPYPTTPQPTNMPSSSLSSQFLQPQPQQGSYFSSSSMPTYPHMHSASFSGPPMGDPRRRSSSFGQHDYPPFPHNRGPSFPAAAGNPTAPIAIPHQQSHAGYGYAQQGYASYPGYQQQQQQQQQPYFHRRTSSHASRHSDERYSSQDSRDGRLYGDLDPDTLREYERRYAKEKHLNKELEKRPTLGGSVMSMVGKMGRAFGSDRH